MGRGSGCGCWTGSPTCLQRAAPHPSAGGQTRAEAAVCAPERRRAPQKQRSAPILTGEAGAAEAQGRTTPDYRPRLEPGPAQVLVTEPWGGGQASLHSGPPGGLRRSPAHAPAPQARLPAHLHQHRLAELLPVDDFDGHLLAGDAVNPQLHEACGERSLSHSVLGHTQGLEDRQHGPPQSAPGGGLGLRPGP